jgi:guanine deaminase
VAEADETYLHDDTFTQFNCSNIITLFALIYYSCCLIFPGRLFVTDEYFMRLALAKGREGVDNGQLPFGAVIVKDGEVVSSAHNTIIEDGSILSHAETNAIVNACHKLGMPDLSGCTLYATCEPCPMCFSAAVLAKVSRIVYSARLGDVIIPGFSMLPVRDDELKAAGHVSIELTGDCLRADGLALYRIWDERQKNAHGLR